MRFRNIILLLFLLNNLVNQAQTNFSGVYRDFFGSTIVLSPDSVYQYSWHFDLLSSWSKGIWKVNKDTIELTNIPVYDTVDNLINETERQSTSKEFVLSLDEKPERISKEQAALASVCIGGQNSFPHPDKFVYRHARLYSVKDNGRLLKKKSRSMFTMKKHPSYYIKD